MRAARVRVWRDPCAGACSACVQDRRPSGCAALSGEPERRWAKHCATDGDASDWLTDSAVWLLSALPLAVGRHTVEHEALDCDVGVHVIGAQKRTHGSPGYRLKPSNQVRAHRLLEGHTGVQDQLFLAVSH